MTGRGLLHRASKTRQAGKLRNWALKARLSARNGEAQKAGSFVVSQPERSVFAQMEQVAQAQHGKLRVEDDTGTDAMGDQSRINPCCACGQTYNYLRGHTIRLVLHL